MPVMHGGEMKQSSTLLRHGLGVDGNFRVFLRKLLVGDLFSMYTKDDLELSKHCIHKKEGLNKKD